MANLQLRCWSIGGTMIRFLFVASLFLAAGTISSWAAFDTEFRSDDRWLVKLDRETRACAATQTAERSGKILIQADAQKLILSIVDKKLSWITDGQTYKVQVQIDRSNWNGEATASVVDNSGALHIVGPVDKFVEAFMRGSSLSATVDGTRYGPYPLSGTTKVIADLMDCLKSIDSPDASNSESVAQKATREFADWEMNKWSKDDLGKVWSLGAIKITTSIRTKPDTSEVAIFDIQKDGGEAVSFEIPYTGGSYHHGTIGLRKLHPWSSESSLVVSNFTGGAHCCTEIRIVAYEKHGPKLIDLGAFDGDDDIVTEDLDGDGYFEIPVRDERFSAFSGYADSFPPTKILTLKEGQIEDITRQERFAGYHAQQFTRQSEACQNIVLENPGACAGLAATASNLGVLKPVLAHLDFETESPEEGGSGTLTLCADDACKEKREFTEFKQALRYALRVWGYGDAEVNDVFSQKMRTLSGRSFGDPAPESELGCEMGAPSVKEAKADDGSPLFRIDAYEETCIAATGTVLGPLLAFKAACQGEGSPMWLKDKLFIIDGERLLEATVEGSRTLLSDTRELKECPVKVP